jgi:hypothetical protein
MPRPPNPPRGGGAFQVGPRITGPQVGRRLDALFACARSTVPRPFVRLIPSARLGPAPSGRVGIWGLRSLALKRQANQISPLQGGLPDHPFKGGRHDSGHEPWSQDGALPSRGDFIHNPLPPLTGSWMEGRRRSFPVPRADALGYESVRPPGSSRSWSCPLFPSV